MDRDDFSKATKETLAKRVGYRCSNPSCRAPTSGPHDEPAKAVNVGVAAHITAAAPGGPRYDPSLTAEQRQAPENGIWLCQTHAKLIDSDPSHYPVALLRQWKQQAEDAALAALESSGRPPDEPPPEPGDPECYLHSLHNRTAHIDIRGLQVGSGRASRFGIDELYIPLTASATWSGRLEKGPADAVAEGVEPRHMGRIELRAALHSARLVIVGDPGAGKTTLLRRIAFLACEAMLSRDSQKLHDQLGLERPLFPILVGVGELTEHMTVAKTRGTAPTREASLGWLPHYLAQASDEADVGLSEAFFRQQLDRGEALVLLDGLDEAPTEQHRKAFVAMLEQITERYDRCRYVLTGRPAAFSDELVLPGFDHVTIDPLEDAAIETFLRRWCQALFADSPADAERHLAELLDALRSRPEIRRMARNPVMLTALAVLHWNQKRLPEQRADLYESIITWLSQARSQRPGRPSAERCVGLLQDLALAMQDHREGRQTQVPRSWAADNLAPSFRELPAERQGAAADQFLREEEVDSGIVVGRGAHVRFWHLTFQEYLAARALAALSDEEQRDVLLAGSKLYAPQWKEVVLLLAGVLCRRGVKSVDRMISAVLDRLGHRASVADRAACVALLGAAVHDLRPVNYQPSDPRYRKLLDDVMAVFEPDWLQRAGGGLWSRLLGVVAPQRSQAALMRLASQVADVLGQAGISRFDPAELDKCWVTIPAGKFMMGAQSRDPQRANFDKDAYPDESPVHEVYLDEFRIAVYPVTVGQYQRFVEDGGYQKQDWWQAGGFRDFSEPEGWEDQLLYPARPVVGVSWYEAAAYCAWKGCRLPTEAEWERAARGPDGRKYPWGNEPAEVSRLNFAPGRKPTIGHPTPVGIYPRGATPDGIHDMAGNVWEWCADWFGEYSGQALSNPRGLDSATPRVFRGGCWADVARLCRAAFRGWTVPWARYGYLGLRVAAPVPPGKSSPGQAPGQAEPGA